MNQLSRYAVRTVKFTTGSSKLFTRCLSAEANVREKFGSNRRMVKLLMLIPTVSGAAIYFGYYRYPPQADPDTIIRTKAEPQVYKVKDLPIYTQVRETVSSPPPVGMGPFRQQVFTLVEGKGEALERGAERMGQIWETSKAHSASLVDSLREGDTLTQAGVISGAALLGLLLGIRGGKIKKTFYATTLGLGTAAFLNPEPSKELVMPYMKQATQMVKDALKNISS